MAPSSLRVAVAPRRLRSSADIRAVFASRTSSAGRLLVLHVRRRGDDGPPRVAVIASRKVGGAVQRNRAKRVLREAARTVPLAAGRDLVLIARRGAREAAMAQVAEELEHLAGRLDVLEAPSP